jgi:hypothetical protein
LEPHCRYKNTIRYSHSHSTAAATRSRPPPSVYPPRICPIAAAPPPLQVRPPPLLAFANPTDGGWRQRRKRPARKDVAFGPNCSRLSLNCGVLVPLCVCVPALLMPRARRRAAHTKDNATVWSHANSIRSRGSDNFLRVCFLI